MTQPTFADGPPVPLMVEGTLDSTGVRQLFAELSSATAVVGVRMKDSPTRYTNVEEPTLDEAVERLLSGGTRAVQVRYYFAQQEWSDTIMGVNGRFRVVRCRQE